MISSLGRLLGSDSSKCRNSGFIHKDIETKLRKDFGWSGKNNINYELWTWCDCDASSADV